MEILNSPNARFHKFNIGEFICTSLYDKHVSIPIRKLIPDLSNITKEKTSSELAALDGHYEMGLNVLLLEHNGTNILIDSGLANGALKDSMQTAGISNHDIDIILITHGDGDHIGGLETFENARLIMVEESFNKWTSTSGLDTLIQEFEMAMKSVFPIEVLEQKLRSRRKVGESLYPKLKHRIELVKPNEECLPGIRFIEAKGHRSDHYAIEISSNDECLIHIADALRHPVQFMGNGTHTIFDSYPEKTVETIHKIMELSKQKNAMLFGAHITFPGILSL